MSVIVNGVRRVQLSRRKGAKIPEGAMSVARPTKWGNPWTVEEMAEHYPEDSQHALAWKCVADFKGNLEGKWDRTDDARPYPSIAEIKAELAGHDLACWCPLGEPCHADVLLEIANT